MKIANNTVASIDYTLTDAAGAIIDSSSGFEPLKYLHGAANIIPGLERELEGLAVGDEKKVVVNPQDGYGLKNESLLVTMPKDRLEVAANVQVGMKFHAETPEGVRVMRVINVGDDTVTLDGNHELAGETLYFQVKVTEVREAKEVEIEHGHPHSDSSCGHGCGCHN